MKRRKTKKTSQTIDILGHFLVPEMRILSEDQATKLLGKYGIQKGQLPQIYVSDPEAEALKANVGDVVAIERRDATAKYTAYRVVISG